MAIPHEIRTLIETLSNAARTPKDKRGLQRLLTKPCALDAWDLLQKKNLSSLHLQSIAFALCRAGSAANLSPASRKTKNEIVQAAADAEGLAIELAKLIEDNETLQFRGERLRFEDESAAIDCLRRGISAEQAEEAERETWQRGWGSSVEMNLYQASVIAWAYSADPAVFPRRLRLFANLAKKSRTARPIAPHPGALRTPELVFAAAMSRCMVDTAGSPCHSIVAKFTSAVFEGPTVTAAQVKKWWQRGGDKIITD